MITNNSPWLHQLNRSRPINILETDIQTDVAIIGGGIAGVSTAFFTLKNTQKRVTLVEANKIAHGATGHNGGFLASYFERSFSSLVEEFGLELTGKAQKDIDSAWLLLEEMRQDATITSQLLEFTGYAACATKHDILVHLENNRLRQQAGLAVNNILVSEEIAPTLNIPEIYTLLYDLVPKQKILDLLETNDEEYIALIPERKGCMNSAVFCEEVISYLLQTYPDRFSLLENTPVKRLVLKNDYALLTIPHSKKITAKEVVLCTNGFEYITIVNTVGPALDKKFHYLVRGIVGYMAGYLETQPKPAVEISYLTKSASQSTDVYTEDPYFYLTRRPFEKQGEQIHNLICIGGPEELLEDTRKYQLEGTYPEKARIQIDNFLRSTYKHSKKDKIEYKFLWHGLMGFTPNGVRLIGPEPLNPILYYNLGCNGVGLLPSIYGGKRISDYLSGKNIEPSIFDPKKEIK